MNQDALDDLTKFVDNAFHESLFNHIKSEVQNCVKSELKKHEVNRLYANELNLVSTPEVKKRDSVSIEALHE